MTMLQIPKPKVGDSVLYDNGGRDIGEEGKVVRVLHKREVEVNGHVREVRFVARGEAGCVWCINGKIGPNKYAKQFNPEL